MEAYLKRTTDLLIFSLLFYLITCIQTCTHRKAKVWLVEMQISMHKIENDITTAYLSYNILR